MLVNLSVSYSPIEKKDKWKQIQFSKKLGKTNSEDMYFCMDKSSVKWRAGLTGHFSGTLSQTFQSEFLGAGTCVPPFIILFHR